jgi:hypothetical protein
MPLLSHITPTLSKGEGGTVGQNETETEELAPGT